MRKEKYCAICKETKPVSEYRLNRCRYDGIGVYCRECQTVRDKAYYRRIQESKKEYAKKYFQKNKKHLYELQAERKKDPIEQMKDVARSKLRNAVTSGEVKKYPCEVCGEKKSEGHHPDYEKPLEVRWLCSSHHKQVHLNIIP